MAPDHCLCLPLYLCGMLKHCMLVFVLWFIATPHLPAQEPFHYLIGEEALAGIDIYSMLQDHDANVWIATNHGLFRYDGYTFYNCPSENLSDVSLFSLTQDSSGTIYCLNLSGQIFQVRSDSLRLHYQIPDSLMLPLLSIEIDDQDELVVDGRQLFKLKSDLSVEVISKTRISDIWRFPDGALLCADIVNGQFFRYSQGQITPIYFPHSIVEGYEFQYLVNGKHERVVNSKTLDQYIMSGRSTGPILPIPTQVDGDFHAIQGALSREGNVWLASGQGGIVVMDSTGAGVYGNRKVLEKYLVSYQMEDREGNRWLGTKDRGILILPNPKVLDYSNHPYFKDSKIIGLAVGKGGNVFVNTDEDGGKIFRIDSNETVTLLQIPLRGSEGDFFSVLGDDRFLIANGVNGGCWDLKENKRVLLSLSSIKSCWMLGEKEMIWANPNGVVMSSWGDTISKTFRDILSFPDARPVNNIRARFGSGRTNSVVYQARERRLWMGQNRGLSTIDAEGVHEVLAKGETITSTDIELVGDQIWVGTENAGLYCFEGQVLKHHFQKSDGLLADEVRKLEYSEGYLYLMSRRGVQRMDPEDFTMDSFGSKDGLLPGAIRDFGVFGDDIWLYTLNGLQKFRFADLRSNSVRPILNIDSILVNDEVVSIEENAEYAHDQNKIEFHFIGKAYRHRGTLRYQYRLLGLDSTWQEKGYTDRTVTYNALPAGEFLFELVGVNEDGIASLPFQYQFSISQPYWLKWWFWVGSGILLIGILSTFFLIRIQILRRSLALKKKLKDSELVAIKAQMNPHFVFNVLNSFQDLIYQQDFRKTNTYLGKFAGLMRKTLEFSDRDAITLSEEMELLEDYLDLEKLRFGEDFVGEIVPELEGYNADSLTIPSMLLQPYVENAIKHGLLHKKGKKELLVRFLIQKPFLVCEIRDNGIGREASGKIKERRQKYHQPFAATATQKRIDLMNQSREQAIGLTVEDLLDASGEPCGTLVQVSFPIEDNEGSVTEA